MAHQAIDVGQPYRAIELANASLDGDRYARACPRERALLGVIRARALAADGRRPTAARALLQAEKDLSVASPGGEPQRVFFFGEAALAHETGCTLRDMGDLGGAERELRRSVRTRQAAVFTRTHAVTLGYLADVQARANCLDEACVTWSGALEVMESVSSGRTLQNALRMRETISSHHGQDTRAVREVAARTAEYLSRYQ